MGREAPRIHYPVTQDHCTDPGYPFLTIDRKTQKRSHWLLFLLICIASIFALINPISTVTHRVDPNVLCWYTHNSFIDYNRDPSSIRGPHSIRHPHQEKYGSGLGARDLQRGGSEIETRKLQETLSTTCCPQLRTRGDKVKNQLETAKEQHRTQVDLHYAEQTSNQIRSEEVTRTWAPDPGVQTPQFRRKKVTKAWTPDLGAKIPQSRKISQCRRNEKTGEWAPDRSTKTSNPGARASNLGATSSRLPQDEETGAWAPDRSTKASNPDASASDLGTKAVIGICGAGMHECLKRE